MNYPRWFQVFHLMISVFKNLSLFTLFAALFIRSDRPKKWLSLNQSHTLDFSLSFMSAWLGCVCLYVCVCARLRFCVLDPDSYHFWHKVVVFWRLCPVSCCNSFPVMAERTSAPRCSQPWLLQYLHVYAHNFHLLFLEQSAAGGLERSAGNCCKSRSTWVSWLGGWAWLCSTRRRGREGRGGGPFSFLQGPLKVSDGGLGESEGSGDPRELALREELHQGEISHCGPVTPLQPAKLTNGFQIHYRINRKVQMWSETFYCGWLWSKLVCLSAMKLQQQFQKERNKFSHG